VKSPDGEELSLSPPVDILEKANSASGKFGGVAGVLHGVHTWQHKIKCCMYTFYQYYFPRLQKVVTQ
jgi:hypothetical protein